jgi:hypothetical protein
MDPRRPQPAAQPAFAALDLGHARDTCERRRRTVQAKLDVALAPGQESRHVFERDEAAEANDRDAIAHPLDLGQDMR